MRIRNWLMVLAAPWALLATADSAPAQIICEPRTQALIHVVVPSPSAKLWFDAALTHSNGTQRTFVTPPLSPNWTFHYAIKASWVENGREVTEQRRVDFRSGQEIVVDFRGGRAPIGVPATQGVGSDEDRPLTPPLAPEMDRQPPVEERPLTPRIASEPKEN